MKRTDKTVTALLKAIESGLTIDAACRLVGIHRSTWYEWREQPELQSAISQAMAKAEAALLATIKTAGQTDWRAAAWILERRWPDTWLKRQEVQAAGQIEVVVKRQGSS
jgi:hypothetical protein